MTEEVQEVPEPVTQAASTGSADHSSTSEADALGAEYAKEFSVGEVKQIFSTPDH
jgi:hypothetical protein